MTELFDYQREWLRQLQERDHVMLMSDERQQDWPAYTGLYILLHQWMLEDIRNFDKGDDDDNQP